MIWRAVDDEALAAEVQATAVRLRDGAPRALAVVPKVIDRAFLNSYSDQLDLERDVQSTLSSTLDFREAVVAFNEKRKPVFRGQ